MLTIRTRLLTFGLVCWGSVGPDLVVDKRWGDAGG
jgi:hypothetical protein